MLSNIPNIVKWIGGSVVAITTIVIAVYTISEMTSRESIENEKLKIRIEKYIEDNQQLRSKLEDNQKQIDELKNNIEINNFDKNNNFAKDQENKILEISSESNSLKKKLEEVNLNLSDCKFNLQKYEDEAVDYAENKNQCNNELSLLKEKLFYKDKSMKEMNDNIKCLSDRVGDVAEKECNIKKEGAR